MFWTVKKPPLPFTVFFSKNQKKALLHTGTKKKNCRLEQCPNRQKKRVDRQTGKPHRKRSKTLSSVPGDLHNSTIARILKNSSDFGK